MFYLIAIQYGTSSILLFMCFGMQVHCDATIAFPLLVAETFARRVNLEGYDRSDVNPT